MDFFKNYYKILNLNIQSTKKEIKKSYYKLSFIHHPDKGGDQESFSLLTEAYNVLIDPIKKEEYDSKSKWGKDYDERSEMLEFEFNNISSEWDEDKFNNFKKGEILNIVKHVDVSFDGSIEYERWVVCKVCKGSGKDFKSKIEIKDKDGKVIRIFESEEGCDFCNGSGKDEWDNDCGFCFGQGKSGSNICKNCQGEKRILGNQKLTGIDFEKDQKDIKIEFMGNFSKIPGKVGHLWIIRDI